MNANGVLTTYTYSDANRLMTANAAGAITTYTSDAAGNQVQVEDPSAGNTYYNWNAANTMVTAQPPAGVVSLTYDADGRRTQKQSTDGSVTNFLYDFKTMLHEFDDSDNPLNTYTVAAASDEYGDMISEYGEHDTGGDSALYHQFDAQWSTNAMLDDSGTVVANLKFKAFGLPASGTSDGWSNLSVGDWANMSVDGWAQLPVNPYSQNGFGGQKQYYLDPETELYLMGSGTNGR